MYWEAVADKRILLSLRVDHEFLDWLRPRVNDSEVTQLDPFRDVTLDRRMQSCWLTALRQAHDDLLVELRKGVEKRTNDLPQHHEPREAIIRQLVKQRMAEHLWAKLLGDLAAMLELSLESHASVRILGE